MSPAARMELFDRVADLDRAREIVLDLLDRLNAHGDHEVAVSFALDAIEDAADFLFGQRDGGSR
jgi:hypothetical protein